MALRDDWERSEAKLVEQGSQLGFLFFDRFGRPLAARQREFEFEPRRGQSRA